MLSFYCCKIYFITTVGPAFQISSTKKGTVAVTQGQKAILQCDVKSIPQSNICWQSSIEISAYTVKTEKTEDKGEIITKSSFILDYPVSKHDGKLVLCIVRQKYGAILQRGFTLKYKSGKKFNSRCFLHEDHLLYGSFFTNLPKN